MALEGPDMGNVLYRNGKWHPSNVINYLTSPFYQKWLWYPALWTCNWIVMTGAGAVLGLCLI